ncbi:MAG: phasin family protein [Kaiparowitsia implicata GSE-PSE-MK54-09C]|nr:phasin family protein [Kaiparowitsia implicata GSE-PSE-MK54-09C]
MADFSNLVQKAFYLGVGLASYAGERAGGTLAEVRSQAQKLADELVARGEITADEAKRMVEEMMQRAQQPVSPDASSAPSEPRRIEILTDDEPIDGASTSSAAQPTSPATGTTPSVETGSTSQAAEDLRRQVAQLQDELRRLKRD